MSAIPPSTPLPECTRAVVIDLLFKRKYHLTLTQTILMSYLMLLKNWAKCFDGFYLLTTGKIESDLVLGTKTIEATFTRLKKLGLIETKSIKMDSWNCAKNFRGVKITSSGMEYNLSHYKPEEHQKMEELKAENEKLKVKNAELEKSNSDLELHNKAIAMSIEGESKLTQESFEAIEKSRELETKSKELEEKVLTLEKELQNAKNSEKNLPPTPKILGEKESSKNRGNSAITHKVNNKIIFYREPRAFQRAITKEYAESGLPICNRVEGWQKDVEFYINSYSRVAVKLIDGTFRQLVNPTEISNFWGWLYKNQNRVGDIVDNHSISALIPFIDSKITLNGHTFTICKLKADEGGVRVHLKDAHNQIVEVGDGAKGKILDIDKCEKWFRRDVVA